MTRPFLKWAGSKTRLLNRILPLLPQGQRLIEPFVGSGAVFLNSTYDRYLLCDTNPDLIGVFTHLQNEQESFVAYARTFFTPENNSKPAYLDWRQVFNETTNPRLKSALFLYLNRHGYNGLCRYNQKGGFNVPFGQYNKPYFPEAELYAFLDKLDTCHVSFKVQDFRQTFAESKRDDVIYCDPPYVPLSSTANFTSYAAGGFGSAEQEALAQLADEAASRNIPVIISNHNTPLTLGLYKSAKLHAFDVQRNISCIGDKRQKAAELLAVFAS